MIDKLPYGFINSVYDFNDYTLNELICKLAQKMDEVITQSNESFNYLEWLKDQGLSDEVIKILLEWKENGTLETIINEKTGVFFDKQETESLKNAIEKFEKLYGENHFISEEITEHAKTFSEERFIKEFTQAVEETKQKIAIKN